MSRLIDADKLIEELKESYDDDLQKELEYLGIYEFIKEQPTAYNVDKVVEQLEELKDYRRFNGAKTFDNGFKQGEKYGYKKAIDDFADKISTYGTYDDYGNVIDVLEIAEKLKAGGIDDNNK